MKPEDADKTPEDVMKMRFALNDPGMMQKALDEQRDARDNPDLNVDQLTAELWLYPRVRPATIAYVDLTEGRPSNFVNLDVFTPGSSVIQGAVGKIPKWAQEHFRLDRVQFFTKEPGADDPEDGSQFQHVAFWPPESEEDAPTRLERRPKR
jgi:hypothetical protein